MFFVNFLIILNNNITEIQNINSLIYQFIQINYIIFHFIILKIYAKYNFLCFLNLNSIKKY
jgi:hypothetical protein